jgi:hypothetical protein
MAKATLTFDLDDPEDKASFAMASKAQSLTWVIWDLDEYLHHAIENPGTSDDELAALESVRERLRGLVAEREVYGVIFEV